MSYKAAEVVPEVTANYYCKKFEKAFEAKSKDFSAVSEVVLGRDTLSFRFNDHSTLTVGVANVGTALTIWSAHFETAHAKGLQAGLSLVA